MKILVTGVHGQLGHDVCKVLDARHIENKGVDIEDFDITDAEAVLNYIEAYRPSCVIHCAAYTAVDKAEEQAALCARINVDGPRNIAEACKAVSAAMVYISTDYVFPGTGENAYEVDDATGPLGVYGRTKLDGENAVRQVLDAYFIVRTSWVFGKNGNNFVKTMLRLAETRDSINVVCDQIGAPTYTPDLARLLCDMVLTQKYGIYHAANEGLCSWAEFAQEIFKLAGKQTVVQPIPTEQYPTPAQRPKNSRLSKKRLDEAGFTRLPEWKDALQRYLEEIAVIEQ